MVLEPVTNKITAHIVCDTNGVPAVSEATVTRWVNEANRIHRQVAMSFYLDHFEYITNQNWYVLRGSSIRDIRSYSSNTGGIELYCVSNFSFRANGIASDLRLTLGDPWKGIVVKSNAPIGTLAHEIGHACRLVDIDNLFEDQPTSFELQNNNWTGGTGAGYYKPGTMHNSIIQRLLLCWS